MAEPGLQILRRMNWGDAKSGPCWVVDVELPDGRLTTVHDPAQPEFHACGQPDLCAEVRGLYTEGAAKWPDPEMP